MCFSSSIEININGLRHLRLMTAIILLIFSMIACDDENMSQLPITQDLSIDMMGMQDMMIADTTVNLDSTVSELDQDQPLEPQDCHGIRTTFDCLDIKINRRNLLRQWSAVNIEQDLLLGIPQELEVSTTFAEDHQPSTDIRLSLANGEQGITVNTLTLFSADDISSVEFELAGLKADRIFQTGHQSWSFSGAIEPNTNVKRDEEGHLLAKEARTGDPLHGEKSVSFGVIGGQVGEGDRSGVWLVGHLEPSYALSAFAAETQTTEDHSIKLIVRIGFGDVPLQDEAVTQRNAETRTDQITQELVLITAPTMWQALRAYQSMLSESLEILKATGLRSDHVNLNPQRPPGGWYSWNERFEEIDAPYIAEHIELVHQNLSPLGLNLVEIDDGWQRGWGEWHTNDHFPNQFTTLLERATELEIIMGLWMAPFLVDVEVADRLNYPKDWFIYPLADQVTSPESLVKPSLEDLVDIEPLRHRIIGNPRTYYVIDTSHPNAMDHVFDQLKLFTEQGFSFFKLDFLYAAAIPGRRIELISGVESLRFGLSRIREAVGHSVINGCGAPVHAVLGYVDSLRVGSDTTFGELYPSFIASAARSVAARAYLYPLLWPDADQVQTRFPYSEEEAKVGAYVAALSGPAFSIGDDLTQLDSGRLNIFQDMDILWWTQRSSPAIPIHLMSDPSSIWIGNPLGDHLQVMNGTAAPPPYTFINFEDDQKPKKLTFTWSAPFSVNSSE